MLRHPAPDRVAAFDAAAAIIERRTLAQDPDLAQLRGNSLEGVVAHIARHGDPDGNQATRLDPGDRIGIENQRQDVIDTLLILDYLDDAYRRRLARWRLATVLSARRAGMTPTMLQDPLHQRHRQGVVDLIGRLRAYLDRDVGVHDTRVARDVRRDAAAAAQQRDARSAAIVAFACELLAMRDLVPDDVDESGADLYGVEFCLPPIGQPPGGELVATLRLIVAELAGRPVLDSGLRALVVRGVQVLDVKMPGARRQ